MRERIRICSMAIGVATALAVCGPALAAADGLPYNDIQSGPGGVSFVAGGIGVEAQERLDARADDFNLKLVFTVEEGNYIADVDVVVRDAAGRTVVEETADGPFFMAKLPAGQYKVSATYDGKTRTRSIQVGEQGLRTAYLRWPSDPATDFIIGRDGRPGSSAGASAAAR
jgi:hypothetical protein